MQTELKLIFLLKQILPLIILTLFSSVIILGQYAHPEFEHLTIENGLSQSTVTCIMQDTKGFIWIGTKDGLNKYDGYSFKIFRNNPDDSLSLSDNTITAITEDEYGDIWIGTESGYLNRFDITTGKFYSYKIKVSPLFAEIENPPNDIPPCYSYFSSSTITTLCCDKEGNIWVGTWAHGLFKFDVLKNEYTNHYFNSDEMNSITSNFILSVVQDKAGVIWVGSFGGGLDKLTLKVNLKSKTSSYSFKNYSFKNISRNCISNNRITSLCLTKSGENKLLIGTFGGGINILEYFKDNDSVNFSVLNIKFDESRKITGLCLDKNSFLWAGAFGEGLIKYDLSKKISAIYKNESRKNSIDDNDVISLATDRTGLIWVGTLSGYGINKLNPRKIIFPSFKSNLNVKNGLSDNVVLSFAEDKDSNIWIGTYKGGLNKFNRNNKMFIAYKSEPNNNRSISSNYITSICNDSENNLWIGTYDNGLNLLKKGANKFIHFFFDRNNLNSISNNRITSIIKDNSGIIWIGTFGGGLNKVIRNAKDEISFIHYKFNQLFNSTIADNRIDKIYIDSEGIMWVATYNGCLCKYDKLNDEFTNYKIPSELITSNIQTRVTTIYESGEKELWIGIYGKGLISFNKSNNHFSVYNKIHNIASNNIYGILNDARGNLWISSDNGLCKYNPSKNSSDNYDLNDGLQSMQFNCGAAFKAKNGEMFFGGIDGFNSFLPENIIMSTDAPTVCLTSIRTSDKVLSVEENQVELPHYKNSITFEFAVMDYKNPLRNQFTYKLVGYDENWNYSTGKQHLASYFNLYPGKYIFIIKGANSDGSWSKNEIQFVIIISKPYWQAWWFSSIILLLVIGLIIYFIVLRFQKYLAIEKIKSKLSADLHDEIGSGLTEISLLSEIAGRQLNNDIKGAKENLKLMNERAGELIRNMGDIVWLVNPKPLSLYDLVLRLRDIYLPICEPLMINFRINNLEGLENFKITMEQRQNIYLIFKETINNSLKYSGCKNIIMNIETDDKDIGFTLSDDGEGFDDKIYYRGNGLNNMRRRAETLKNEFEIQSSPGHGTKVILIIKVR